MSLKLLQPGGQPLGQFDGLDTEVLTLLGGEVVTFTSVTATSATDKGAFDVFDGYVNSAKRVVVTKTIAASARPLMLCDEGITGYGTLFGTVVGGTVGQVMTGQTVANGGVLGPHTATGSGKVTCWEKPGLYAVSLDAACDSNATTGLRPTNGTLTTGSPLYAGPAGLLTPNAGTANTTTTLCGRFVDFDTNGSLVNTPNSLIGALKTYAFATFYFNPSS
jgi:hypothetical protein